MIVWARAYYAYGNLPFLNHNAIEMFWMDKAFIMLEDDFKTCENIYSTNRSHKKSPIESLCRKISEMSVDETIEQVNRIAFEKYFSAELNKMHL